MIKKTKCLECSKQATHKGFCYNHYMVDYRRRKNDEALNQKIEKRSFLSELKKNLLSVFETQTDEKISEWSSRNIKLPDGEGAQGASSPDWSISPEMVEILEFVKDPDVREIYLMFSSQSSKSLTQFVILSWFVAVRRVNGMFVAPSVRLFKRLKRRLSLIFEASDVGFHKEQSGEDFFKFGHNFINMALATSADSLAEQPAEFVVMDEIDEIPDQELNPVQLARSRLRTKKNSKLVLGSTPKKLEGKGGILDYYNNSKKYVLEMNCPHCSEWSHFTNEHISAPEGATYKEIAFEGLGFAICPENGCEIADEFHDEMVQTQRWKCLNPEEPAVSIGFYKPVWNTIFEDWSSVASERLKTELEGENSHKDFFNSWCAQPVDLSAKIVDLEDNDFKLEKYKRGQIPADVKALTLGIDLGVDLAYCVLLGWSENGKVYEIWDQTISWDDRDFRKIERGLQNLLNDIGREIRYLGEGPTPRVHKALFDSGYKTPEVYDFCRRNALFSPAKGKEPLSKAWIVNKADPNRKFGARSKGVNLYTIKSYYWQNVLDSMLQREADSPNSFNVPFDVHNRYVAHLNAEVRRLKIDKKGNQVEVWEKAHRLRKNDFRDATIYAIVAGCLERLNEIASSGISAPSDFQRRTIKSATASRSVAERRRISRSRRN